MAPAKRTKKTAGAKRRSSATVTLTHPSVGDTVVIGREAECRSIKAKIDNFIDVGTGFLVYVTGMPGSGKTHVVKTVLGNLKREFVWINCATLRTRNAIYREIGSGMSCFSGTCTLQKLRAHFHSCTKKHVLIIDEIDFLYTPNEIILYNLLELHLIEGASLLIVAISNTLGKLGSRTESRIGKERIEFKPYTSTDLTAIATEYLTKQATAKPTTAGTRARSRRSAPLQPPGQKATELIAKRVAAATGDVRKLFEIIACTECGDINSVYSYIQSISRPLIDNFILSLQHYQKILLHLNMDRTASLTEWFKEHKSFCTVHSIGPLDFISFVDVVDGLVEIGLYKRRDLQVESLFLKEEVERLLNEDGMDKTIQALK